MVAQNEINGKHTSLPDRKVINPSVHQLTHQPSNPLYKSQINIIHNDVSCKDNQHFNN